jgi:hypothetical protein
MTTIEKAVPSRRKIPRTDTTSVRAAVALGATAVSVLGLLVGILGELLDSNAAMDAAWVVFLFPWPVAMVAGAMAWELGNLHGNRRDRRAGLVAVSYFPVVWALELVSWWRS